VVQAAFGREWASPEQIADVVAFMASGRASYVSGTVVNVDLGASRA
jgi:NAD(P)-dependent dehydrogenase (short-subunit alcohol dehydrogenase family)